MNTIKYSLRLFYRIVSFLKIINVQKYFGLYIEQIILHCVYFFSPLWIPGAIFESYGDTGQVFIGWACPAYCRVPVVPETLLQTQVFSHLKFQKVSFGDSISSVEKSSKLPWKSLSQGLHRPPHTFLGQIEGSVSPGVTELIYHCIPHGWGHGKQRRLSKIMY